MTLLDRRREREAQVSPAELCAILSYDGETGKFRWKQDRSHRVKEGAIAGSTTAVGYRCIEIRDSKFMAHRIAWAIVHGEWPPNDIDHINGDIADNRLLNLRPATRSKNCCNRRNESLGKSRIKGVHWHTANKKWVARAGNKYLGTFETIADAQTAYQRAAGELFGSYARQT